MSTPHPTSTSHPPKPHAPPSARVLDTTKQTGIEQWGRINELRQEVSLLEKCITKETCMVNALLHELQHPINIHRWRILEAVDPEAMHLVKKINVLKKRLVDHNEDVRKQNGRINEKEHVYMDIKNAYHRLPGLETPEEQKYYEDLYDRKKKKLEELKNELATNEAQTAFYRGEVIKLSKRMEELKQAYFQKRKAEDAQMQSAKRLTKTKLK